MPVAYVTVPANNELTNREIVERIINSMLMIRQLQLEIYPLNGFFLIQCH